VQSSAGTKNRAMIRKIDSGEKRESIDAECKEYKQRKQTY